MQVRAVGWPGAHAVEVGNAADVEELADRLIGGGGGDESGGCLPGIEVGEAPGGTMSIGVGAERWALFVTDEHLDQRCTCDDQQPGGSVDVDWGEPTPIPRRNFVARARALVAVETWLRDRALAPEVDWCEDCA
jgi:hypothetical protein